MSNEPLSVLVVDDSALMRNLISRIINSVPDLTVCGTAMNGAFALQKIPRLNPDILVLDIEMPEMNGIEFLTERRERGITVPVIILSSMAKSGAQITMDALSLGASDFLMKPSGSISEDIHTVGDQLIGMVRAYGAEYRRRQGGAPPTISDKHKPTHDGAVPGKSLDVETTQQGTTSSTAPTSVAPARIVPEKIEPEAAPGVLEIIAIGVSTGGPNALRKVLADIDADLNLPIIVVQHMPPGFTTEFAKSLNRLSPLEVKEAEEGDLIKPGRVLIAPGNKHITVEKKRLAATAHLNDDPPRNGHRPSADVLFASVAEHYGNRSLAVIMTGMGRDGAEELGTIYRKGGITLGQDEASSIVYGMPRVAFERGFVGRQVSLDDMAKTINQIAQERRE